MKLLDQLDGTPKQQYNLAGENGELIGFFLYYMPTVQLWACDISYKDFITKGIIVTVSSNLLHNYANLLPFGLACTSADGLDPYYLTDFAEGRIKIYLLNTLDLAAVEREVFET